MQTERDQHSTIEHLHRELEMLRSDKLKLLSDAEELKRRLQRLEVEKKEVDSQRARLERERLALNKHLENVTPVFGYG